MSTHFVECRSANSITSL